MTNWLFSHDSLLLRRFLSLLLELSLIKRFGYVTDGLRSGKLVVLIFNEGLRIGRSAEFCLLSNLKISRLFWQLIIKSVSVFIEGASKDWSILKSELFGITLMRDVIRSGSDSLNFWMNLV